MLLLLLLRLRPVREYLRGVAHRFRLYWREVVGLLAIAAGLGCTLTGFLGYMLSIDEIFGSPTGWTLLVVGLALLLPGAYILSKQAPSKV